MILRILVSERRGMLSFIAAVLFGLSIGMESLRAVDDDAKTPKKTGKTARAAAPPKLTAPATLIPPRNSVKKRIEKKAQAELDAVADEIKLQFEAQLRPLMNGELHFVETVCALSPEQLAPVKRIGEEQLKELAAQIAVAQHKQQQAVNVRMLGNPGQTPSDDPRGALQDRMARGLRTVLATEQLALYRDEIEKRKAFRRRAHVVQLVGRLDRVLALNDVQRDALTETLLANWQDSWNLQQPFWQHNDQYFPQLADQWIVRHLEPKQVTIWQGLQKIGGMVFMQNQDIFAGVNIDDVPWKPEIDVRAQVPAVAAEEEANVEAKAP